MYAPFEDSGFEVDRLCREGPGTKGVKRRNLLFLLEQASHRGDGAPKLTELSRLAEMRR